MSTVLGITALCLFVAGVLILGVSLCMAAKRADEMTDECEAILRKARK